MNCRVGCVCRRGSAMTVEQSVDPGRVARAVRTGQVDGEPPVAVAAPEPGPAHEYVGCLRPGMGLRLRTALAAAGRARGLSTPSDEALAEARERLADLSTDTPDTAATAREQRREVAEVAPDTDRLRERVAAARGELAALRREGTDGDADIVADRLASAVADLSEAETSAAAAAERLARERSRIRSGRDVLERRLRLEDRVANLERAARAHLVDELAGPFAEAVAAVPGASPPDPFDAAPVVAAFAIARLARPAAPVVVAGENDHFGDASGAHHWLDAPVIYIR